MDKTYEELAKNSPYLTGLTFSGKDYIGVLQNQNTVVTSFYDYEGLPTAELKNKLLELADSWWWESNRKLPINIFIGESFAPFRPYLVSFSLKECEVVFGPTVQLSDLTSAKRIRRKTVQLIRRVN